MISVVANKSAPTSPTGLVENLFNNVLVSKPAKNNLLCKIHAEMEKSIMLLITI